MSETPQGPEDPHGEGGIDAPAPPGGPLRTDTPATGRTPGENAPDPGPAATRVTRPDHDTDPPEPAADEDSVQGEAERAAQEENAGSSLDQPSG